jgi:hypothetical protein
MNPMERAIARSAHGLNEADRLAGLPARYDEETGEDRPEEGEGEEDA